MQDLELSLRRSQHYCIGSDTQHFNNDQLHGGAGPSAGNYVHLPWGPEGQDSNHPGQPVPPVHGMLATGGEDLNAYASAEQDLTASLPMPTVSTGPAVTPELGGSLASADVQDDGTTPPPEAGPQQMPLFSIFMPNCARQVGGDGARAAGAHHPRRHQSAAWD